MIKLKLLKIMKIKSNNKKKKIIKIINDNKNV